MSCHQTCAMSHVLKVETPWDKPIALYIDYQGNFLGSTNLVQYQHHQHIHRWILPLSKEESKWRQWWIPKGSHHGPWPTTPLDLYFTKERQRPDRRKLTKSCSWGGLIIYSHDSHQAGIPNAQYHHSEKTELDRGWSGIGAPPQEATNHSITNFAPPKHRSTSDSLNKHRELHLNFTYSVQP